MTLGKGKKMALTANTHIPSLIQVVVCIFQLTGCNSFWKVHCFHFFLHQSLSYQIWPCHKKVKVNTGSSFEQNYDGQESQMLHTKFCENRSTGSRIK